ncbi:MAG: hypothetical protein P4M00_19985 [Azospirillaceae bacterium]|nr:hypothetical protein [Azospirillaceae bacterium]
MTMIVRLLETTEVKKSTPLSNDFQRLSENVEMLTRDLEMTMAQLDRIGEEAAWSISFCASCASAWETGDVSAMEAERDRLIAQLVDHKRPRLVAG